jgi:hypothetical protein
MSMLVIKKILLGCGIAALALGQLKAQTVENIASRFDGEKMVVTYDLNFSNPAEKFRVDLYSSHDNYTKPLSFVKGAVGDNVLPGKSNRVEWDAQKSLPADFDGEITIRVKIIRMAAPALVLNPLTTTIYKRGRTLTLNWSGARPEDKLNIILHKGNQVNLRVQENADNNGKYEWKLPRGVKGKDYSIKLSPANRPTEVVTTQSFIVKPRVPFIVKVLPFLAVGGAAAVLLGGGGEEPGGDGDSALPGPLRPNGG